MEAIPTNDVRNFCCNCKTLQKDTFGPSDTPKDLIQKNYLIKRLPEYTHPTFPSFKTSTPILSRSSSIAQGENQPVTSDTAQGNTINCQLYYSSTFSSRLHY